MAKLGDYNRWFKPCERCGLDNGRKSEKCEARCWKCGGRIKRDYSDRALKTNSTNKGIGENKMIKDLPHTTVEQVLRLRKAAIELEQQNDKLTADNAALVEALDEMYNLNIKMIRDFNGRVEPWNQMDEEHLHDAGLLLKQAKGDV